MFDNLGGPEVRTVGATEVLNSISGGTNLKLLQLGSGLGILSSTPKLISEYTIYNHSIGNFLACGSVISGVMVILLIRKNV